ncbi:MAG: hypothetical protein IJT73_04275 [Selenomonadaceae bacterium]|nr:hypothetical protein [Selenomonadaceae bacterium]
MKVLVTAILLGTVSVIIVFISGLLSGVVRFSTLMIRTIWAFSMTSAATFFLMMLFDFFEEKRMEKLKKEAEEIVKKETPAENPEQPQAADGFQPMNAGNLPNVNK